jgi:hypothetical protein
MKERQQGKNNLTLKVFEWCHMALWNFRLCFEPSGLPPLTKVEISHESITFHTKEWWIVQSGSRQ